ncbi:MAG: hypothetical protein J4G05_09450 [Chlorobi bacterium]|nr:hypothetical protein [Chlorobiota bacterium]
MKRLLLFSLAGLMTAGLSTLFGVGNVFRSVKAESQGKEIRIEWKTNSESGFHTFEIERRSNEVPRYRRIGSVAAKGGSESYTFVDNGAFFRTNAEKEFTYRVKAVGSSSLEQYSPPVTVSHKVVSSVKRSWGMIKELFR